VKIKNEDACSTGGVIVLTVDYKGRKYSDFFAARELAFGPGWYVFGRADAYGGIVCRCARPRVKPHYNGRVTRGWITKREAARVASILNGRVPAALDNGVRARVNA
jgi:hypothetical protein